MASRAFALLCVAGFGVSAGCTSRTRSSAPSASTSARPAPSAASRRSPSANSFYADRFSKKPAVSAMTELGRLVFFDTALSASGKMACATCHDPRFGYGPPNDRSTQLGGPELESPGMRAVPSLRYLQTLPPFSEHHFDEAVDESVDQGPTGGHGWDGRVDTRHDQAVVPFTSPFEMANESMQTVVAKVAAGSYASRFETAFGDDVFKDPERGRVAVLMTLEVFQQSPKDFYPYTSRYDAWLRHRGELTPEEQRGLALFDDPKKGNCASCHPSAIRQGAFPLFTDFGFAALGVPRNSAIAANADPHFFDLGLCGAAGTKLASHPEYCGQFRVPPLRNVAARRVFFHNGVFHRLEDVVAFYAARDTDPARFYAHPKQHVEAFDDLPPTHRGNVNREPPFGKKRGQRPALDDHEIADVVAFLRALTDADLGTQPAVAASEQNR
jgi:cytochrome c peroxidase